MNLLHSNPSGLKSPGERGGISILVSMMLLVLLTITTLGMSRNSFREVIISASARQASLSRNLADSGIEWGILWLEPPNQLPPTGVSATLLQAEAQNLVQNNTTGLAFNLDGSAYSGPNTGLPPADLRVPSTSTNGFNPSLTYMGKMDPIGYSTQTGSSTSGMHQASGNLNGAPDLWALRSDGVDTVGGLTFTNSKEAWISTPAR
jgi:Tfp pilus assembly protein PilX